MATSLELPLLGARKDSLAVQLKQLEERSSEPSRALLRALDQGQAAEPRRPLPKAGAAPETAPASWFLDVLPKLSAFEETEREAIPVVLPGRRLRSGETYLDLNRGGYPFEAMGVLTALSNQRLVPKSETDPELWQRLLG